MLIVSSTGGSGSTFVIKELKRFRYKVCVRPDAGRQKLDQTMLSTWRIRTQPFFAEHNPPADATADDLFDLTYRHLKELDQSKLALALLEWGGMGFLRKLKHDDTIIYLVRNPLFAINSYSSGTAWSGDHKKRVAYAGGKDQNDKIWIDAFFGDFSLWLSNAQHALESALDGTAHIVRYYRFIEDWHRIPGLPPIEMNFECKNNIDAVHRCFLPETIAYIKEKTDDIWHSIRSLP